jgi:hypothetical protein
MRANSGATARSARYSGACSGAVPHDETHSLPPLFYPSLSFLWSSCQASRPASEWKNQSSGSIPTPFLPNFANPQGDGSHGPARDEQVQP